jgi:GntR family transcriptional regulator
MNSDPLHLEIADHIAEKIIRGEIAQNGYIDTPKIWAEKTGLNPNSVAKAFDVLVENHIIVDENEKLYKCTNHSLNNAIKYRKDKLLTEDINDIYRLFKLLNISPEEVNNSYKNFLNNL